MKFTQVYISKEDWVKALDVMKRNEDMYKGISPKDMLHALVQGGNISVSNYLELISL